MSPRVLLSLLLAALCAAAAAGACACRGYGGAKPPAATSNAAQTSAADAGALLAGTMGAPHKAAVVAAAVYDAAAAATGAGRPLVRPAGEEMGDADAEEGVAVAGYAALVMVLGTDEERVGMVREKMAARGVEAGVLETHPAAAAARAVVKKFALPMPPQKAPAAKNPPSSGKDADCDAIVEEDRWQAQCLPQAGNATAPCAPQVIPFLGMYNATVMSLDAQRRVVEYTSAVFGGAPALGDEFAAQHARVLEVSGALGDAEKAAAEFFQPRATGTIVNVALAEAVARDLGLVESAALLFGVAMAARDAMTAGANVKIDAQTARPLAVLQCSLAGEEITAWNAPYYGVRTFTNAGETKWRPYLQTPPHPGYVSGHATVATAGAEVLRRFLGDTPVQADNCGKVAAGKSRTEPRIDEGAPGYIAGVTDVPNSGPATVGYSPAEDVDICWETFGEFAEKLVESRLFGGIHIPKDNSEGEALGKIVGEGAFNYLTSFYGVAGGGKSIPCRADGERAIGAQGYPRVWYKPCCNGDAPMEKEGDWGLFCSGKAAEKKMERHTYY